MRPARKVAATIDRYIVALDEARNEKGASAPFLETVNEWRRFAARVGKIDKAVNDPLADGASAVLVKGGELHNAAYEISMALSNVGHAIKRARGGA